MVCKFVEKFSLLYTLGCPDHFNLKTFGRMFNSNTLLCRGGSRISKGGVDGRPYLLRGGRENALTKKIVNNFTCTCLRRVF